VYNISGVIMNIDEQYKLKILVHDTNKVRRVFLKRASAGVLIASIPGRSAWAGINGSIVASGNASDFNQGYETKLKNEHDFDYDQYEHLKFKDVFGQNPYNRKGNFRRKDLNFKDILKSNRRGKRGINDINIALVVMYLNAIKHNTDGIYYPVLSNYNYNPDAFAKYLYSQTRDNPAQAGTELCSIIARYQ
jgi:hypothetical protein